MSVDAMDNKSTLELIDLEQLVKDHALSFLDNSQKRHADIKRPVVDWRHMNVVYGETKYASRDKPPTPTSHILFSACFVNDTPAPQTYTLKTERRTRSSCEINFTKTFTYGTEVQLSLTPPNPIIDINAGFHAEVTKEKGVNRTIEQELSWGVDTEISVPQGYKTKAELVIKEDDFNGAFEMLTTFDGKVLVSYENKDTKEWISTVCVNAGNVFKGSGFSKDDKGRPTYLVKGVCKCRFGIEQFIKVSQLPIEEREKNDFI